MPLRIAPAGPAAWVPFHPDQTRHDANEIAMRWLSEQSEDRARALLVTNDLWTVSLNPQLLAFSRRNAVATPRKQANAPWGVPVLSYSPDLTGLGLAVQRSHGSALCVVEGAVFDVRGWALATGALDLTAGARPGAASDDTNGDASDGTALRPDPSWSAAVEALATLDGLQLADAERVLPLVAGLPPAQRSHLPSALVAHGANPRTLTTFSTILESVGAR